MERPVLLCYRCDDRDAGDPYARIVPSGLFCLHGFLLDRGFPSHLANFCGMPWGRVEAVIRQHQPLVVGVSHFTFNHSACENLYRIARKVVPDTVIVGGGAQATHLDELLLRRIPDLDLVVRGEGETPLATLAERAYRGERSWGGIPGLSFRDGDRVRREPLPPLLPDIDPCYSPRRFNRLEGVVPGEQFPFVAASRGCPGTCRFCNSPAIWRRRTRFRSAGPLAAEIRFLQREHGLVYFSFRDDSFSADPGRVLAWCRTLGEEKLRFLWNCQSRAEGLDRDTLLALKRAGCEQVQFGIETTSPRLQRLLGKPLPPDGVAALLRNCRESGIRTSAYFITGIPGQTETDLEGDLDLFRRWKLQDAVVSPLCRYPGTVLALQAERDGTTPPEDYLSGEPERLLVRRDAAALRLYDTLTRAADRASRKNGFTLPEIRAHLAATGNCFSSRMDLGRYWSARRRPDLAERAWRDIVGEDPSNPVGLLALADFFADAGDRREARKWRDRATRALQYL